MRIHSVVVLVAAAFLLGTALGMLYSVPAVAGIIEEASAAGIAPKNGFTEVNVTISSSTISLRDGCRLIQFDVTPDQAYSIAIAISGESPQRPLTHDIFADVLNNYNITILQINIDRHEEGIYKATIYFRRGREVLALDARPSDSIALAARYRTPLFVKDSILLEQGRNIC